jgi:non-specific serine/threonine protein kinase
VNDAEASIVLTLSVLPSGHVRLAEAEAGGDGLQADSAAAVLAAFERGAGAGVLHLGAVEVTSTLPPAFRYFRELGHELVARVCAHPELETIRDRIHLDPPLSLVQSMSLAVPPITGAEYLTVEALTTLWRDAEAALKHELSRWRGSIAEWLHEKNGGWSAVGRVCFHLAENKRSPDAPFAFLATYTTRLSAKGAPQHRPLGHALEESRATRDRARLLALLLPVQRAAERSALVRALVESGDLYEPLAWTAREAHTFLKEVPQLEAAGVTVRVPDWWSKRAPPRVQVQVNVGDKAPSKLGTDAVLDFSMGLALDGQSLSDLERREILGATDGLVFIKGKWVEADGARLREVLDHWKRVEQSAQQDGLSFHEAMRMLAGASFRGNEAASISEAARDWTRVRAGPWMLKALDGLRSPEALSVVEPGGEVHATLRPYQRTGVQWLWWAHELRLGACLADDMGLGKTLQVLALLVLRKRSPSRAPALLVVPASLVANWKAEATRFCPSLRFVVAHAASLGEDESGSVQSGNLDGADAVLTTYGSLARYSWIAAREWGLLVLDEAQAIKNPGAKQTRLVKSLRARARLALTGTPVENRLGDLWSLFDFLAPGLLGGAKEFGQAAKRMAADTREGYAPLRRLVGPYILRRLKTDKRVIADLPDKTEVVAYCGLTKVQATLYQRAVDDLARAVETREGIERRGAILASLMRLKQICNHPSHWLGDGVWASEASGKLKRLRELCEPIATRQEKVLVFTQFREMTGPLAAFLRDVFGREGLVLHGSIPVPQRKKRVDSFQDEAGPPFFVLSLKAGGTGLNLTAASHVIHFDRWWNPAVENQATDRAFRIGQKKNVMVHAFVCRGTVEERIDALMTSKRGLADAVLGAGAESAFTEMSNEELLRMVSLDLRAAMSDES